MGSLNNDDYYLSDFHVENENSLKDNDIFLTRIEFYLPEKQENIDQLIEQDDDGDLILLKRDIKHFILQIEHHRQTKLADVGLQLWRASFYLTDYLIHLNRADSLNNDIRNFEDRVIIDLGAGIGITSFVSAMFAKQVFCTDLEKIVELAEKNWNLNKHVFSNDDRPHTPIIYFKELDWHKHESFLNENSTLEYQKFQLNSSDLECFKEATIFLAADVIYDDSITSILMNTIYKLMINGKRVPKVCFIANENRVNFSIDTLNLDTAHDYFMVCLNDLNEYSDEESMYKFKTEKVDCGQLPKYISSYKRNEYLSIWMIKCYPI